MKPHIPNVWDYSGGRKRGCKTYGVQTLQRATLEDVLASATALRGYLYSIYRARVITTNPRVHCLFT